MTDAENKPVPGRYEPSSQPDDFGKDALLELVAKAKERAVEAAREIQAGARQAIDRRDELANC